MMPSRHLRRDHGQSTVELALTLPVVVGLLLFVVQVGLLVREQILVVHAAREGARAAAVSPDVAGVRHAAEGSGGLDPERLSVRRSARGAPGSVVEVEVAYAAELTVPVLSKVVRRVELTGAASMRVES